MNGYDVWSLVFVWCVGWWWLWWYPIRRGFRSDLWRGIWRRIRRGRLYRGRRRQQQQHFSVRRGWICFRWRRVCICRGRICFRWRWVCFFEWLSWGRIRQRWGQRGGGVCCHGRTGRNWWRGRFRRYWQVQGGVHHGLHRRGTGEDVWVWRPVHRRRQSAARRDRRDLRTGDL